jgi:hypothetical protein
MDYLTEAITFLPVNRSARLFEAYLKSPTEHTRRPAVPSVARDRITSCNIFPKDPIGIYRRRRFLNRGLKDAVAVA